MKKVALSLVMVLLSWGVSDAFMKLPGGGTTINATITGMDDTALTATNNGRLIYTLGGKTAELPAITATKVLCSNSSGLPIACPENTTLTLWTGNTNIASLGTVTAGTWHASVIAPAYGGTGHANNAANTITFSGNYGVTLTLTGTTALTLPTSGTLITSTDNTSGTAGGLSATLVPASGGTGVANDNTNTITFSGHYPLALTLTGSTSVTLPTSGTIATTAQILCAPTTVDGHAGASPTAATLAECNRTVISNYGQTAAENITLPTAAANLGFEVRIGTAQASNYFRATSATAGDMHLDGGTGKNYVELAAPAVGDHFYCSTFKTGASAWSWMCMTGVGTVTTN